VLYYIRPEIRRQWRLLGAVGIAAFAFVALAGYFRSAQFYGGLDNYNNTYAKAGIPIVLQPLADPYLYLRNVVVAFDRTMDRIPATTPYQNGRVMLAGAAQFLPGHREGAEIFFSRVLKLPLDGGAGIPASLLGVFYADFGVLGILGGMAALGVSLEATYRRFARSKTIGSLVAYAYLLKVALWSLLLGPLPYTTTLTVPLLLALSFSFVRAPQARIRATWPPTWLLSATALTVVGAIVLFYKH